jgi:hypothetical protein
LSNQTSLASAENGGAQRNLKAASQITRPRRRRAPDGYIAVWQLAERADAALSTAYAWVEAGKLAASRWRGIIVVDERDVAEFLRPKPLRSVVADSAEAEANDD